MKPYKKKYQAIYQAEDIKPKGKWKRAIEGSTRVKAKEEINKQRRGHEPDRTKDNDKE